MFSAQGGTAVALTKPDLERREIDHHSPSWLPGGRTLLISVHRGVEAFDVAVHGLDTGERHVLVQDAFEPRYVPTGHLVFVRDDTLFAAPFDADRVELTGAAVAVIENVQTFPHSGNANYRVSGDGSLAYVPAPSLRGRKLVWVDRRGNVEPLPIGPRGFGAPSLSPDGRRLAVHIDDGPRRDIWIYDLGADSLTRATFDGASAAPVWTPDGKRLASARPRTAVARFIGSWLMGPDSPSGSLATTTACGQGTGRPINARLPTRGNQRPTTTTSAFSGSQGARRRA